MLKFKAYKIRLLVQGDPEDTPEDFYVAVITDSETDAEDTAFKIAGMEFSSPLSGYPLVTWLETAEATNDDIAFMNKYPFEEGVWTS